MLVKRYILFLVLILIFGAGLRFWQLGSAELAFDEGLYAFRSIGYLDYLESAAQPTPIQWLANEANLPFWINFSFHDHPPLFFLIQHVFFNVFGDSLLVARLPSALAGLGAIFLMFLIGRDLFRKTGLARPILAGLLAAFLLSISFAHVWISRLSMMESVLFFFILLNIYFFLRLLENKKYWFAFGVTLGLCFLTKYISIFLVPTYIVFLLISQPALLRNKYLWGAFLVALLLFSPVIVYNIYFYQAFGHLDLQFSSFLGLETPDWQGSSGKTQEPFSNIGKNLLTLYSIPFLLFTLAGLAISFLRSKLKGVLWFMPLSLFFITLLLILAGSALRFSALYVIPAVFLITLAVMTLWERFEKRRGLILAGLSLLLVYEIVFMVNLAFIHAPFYGVVRLDQYFDAVFGNARSVGIPRHANPHLDRVIQEYLPRRPVSLEPIGIIYDDNIAVTSLLWLFSRRQYYHGIPIITASGFQEAVQSDESMFQGYTLYFVKAESAAPLRVGRHQSSAEQLELILRQEGDKSPEIIIRDDAGDLSFKVYKFSLQ